MSGKVHYFFQEATAWAGGWGRWWVITFYFLSRRELAQTALSRWLFFKSFNLFSENLSGNYCCHHPAWCCFSITILIISGPLLNIIFLLYSSSWPYHAGNSGTSILCDEGSILFADNKAGDARYSCKCHNYDCEELGHQGLVGSLTFRITTQPHGLQLDV